MTGTVTGHRLGATEAWARLIGVRDPAGAAAAGLHRTGGGWRWREPASAEADQLADLYTPLCTAGPDLVIGQLGTSLDGAIATRTGDAVFVTGEADRLRLHRMRALVDAVVVGVDTVRADDPRLTVRACAGRNPARIVLDHRGRADLDRGLFADGAAPTLWLLGPAAEVEVPSGVEVLRLPCTADGFAPADVLAALAGRGLGRVLVEGGGVTVSRFLAAGALHRLYLAIAPVLVGDGVPGVSFAGTERMADALRAPARRFTLGEDTLFELALRPPPGQQQ
jgi:diaminohydroxyphosphoribosylaminopyrimidine deaminase / 5-amino-6-(5-phosphoribosylamino)uracil reductase